MNENKYCPMKFITSRVQTDLVCSGENCAWWLPYDEEERSLYGENGRCIIKAINGNLGCIVCNTD